MLDLLSYFNTDEVHIAICIYFIIETLYECKFEEPITFIFGKPKLFKGTLKQRIYSWAIFIFLIINFLWVI